MSTFQRVSALRRISHLIKSEALTAADKAGWAWSEGFVCKREFSVDERKTAAKSGAAMSDGSFPIYNETDLHHAISLVGMSNHSESSVKAHIKTRAKAIGAAHALPDSWKVEDHDKAVTKLEVVDMRSVVVKAEESPKKAGIEVQTDDEEPKHGIYSHTLGAQSIGHTVKAVANGTIAWTAVPQNGKIKGGFKKHDDAKQYLADQHVEGVKTANLTASMQQNQKGGQGQVQKTELSQIVSQPSTVRQIAAMRFIVEKAAEMEHVSP